MMRTFKRFRWLVGVLLLVAALAACQPKAGGGAPNAPAPIQTPASTVPVVQGVAPSPTVASAATEEAQAQPTEAEAKSAPTATAQPAAPPTAAAPSGRIAGWVWEDHCTVTTAADGSVTAGANCQNDPGAGYVGDGIRQNDEPALAGIRVQLSQGSCPGAPLSVTVTNGEGYYQFSQVPAGTYCISIDAQDPANAPLLGSGVWTQPGIGAGQAMVVLPEGGAAAVNFAYFRKTAQPTPVVAQPTPTPEEVAEATEAPEPTATPTEIPDAAKPYTLGEPDVDDDMSVPGAHWFTMIPPDWAGWVNYTATGDGLLISVLKPGVNNYWVTSTYPPLTNGYVEATFHTEDNCVRKNRYGLAVRGPDSYEGVLFMVSCDGMYKIFRWNGGFKLLRDWTRTTAIHTGSRQVNRIGVWMEGNELTLYINHTPVDTVEEDLFTSGGIGIVAGAEAAGGFDVTVEEVKYWVLP